MAKNYPQPKPHVKALTTEELAAVSGGQSIIVSGGQSVYYDYHNDITGPIVTDSPLTLQQYILLNKLREQYNNAFPY